MDIEKLIEAVKLCGSTPKVDQCKQCAYWSGGDMSKCIPRMTTAAATALSTLQAELEQVKRMFPGCAKCEYEDDGEPMRIYYPDGWDNGIGFEYGKAIFCPECGKPLTDEAVEITMQRLEAIFR